MPVSQLSAAKLEEAAGTGGAPAATGAPPSHPHPALPAASSAPSFSHPPLPSPSSSSLPRLVPLMAADPLASMVKAEGGTAVGDGGDLGQGLVAASMPAGSLSSTATAPGSPPSYPSPPPPPAPASAEAKSSRLANARQPKGEKVNIVYRVVDGKQYIVGKQGRLFDPNPGPATTGAGDDAVFECCFCDKMYRGKHARSIWRRHLCDKHGIPLAAQPRRTRWDKDEDRPRTEQERRERALESKRKWAAKRRALKRAGKNRDSLEPASDESDGDEHELEEEEEEEEEETGQSSTSTATSSMFKGKGKAKAAPAPNSKAVTGQGKKRAAPAETPEAQPAVQRPARPSTRVNRKAAKTQAAAVDDDELEEAESEEERVGREPADFLPLSARQKADRARAAGVAAKRTERETRSGSAASGVDSNHGSSASTGVTSTSQLGGRQSPSTYPLVPAFHESVRSYNPYTPPVWLPDVQNGGGHWGYNSPPVHHHPHHRQHPTSYSPRGPSPAGSSSSHRNSLNGGLSLSAASIEHSVEKDGDAAELLMQLKTGESSPVKPSTTAQEDDHSDGGESAIGGRAAIIATAADDDDEASEERRELERSRIERQALFPLVPQQPVIGGFRRGSSSGANVRPISGAGVPLHRRSASLGGLLDNRAGASSSALIDDEDEDEDDEGFDHVEALPESPSQESRLTTYRSNGGGSGGAFRSPTASRARSPDGASSPFIQESPMPPPAPSGGSLFVAGPNGSNSNSILNRPNALLGTPTPHTRTQTRPTLPPSASQQHQQQQKLLHLQLHPVVGGTARRWTREDEYDSDEEAIGGDKKRIPASPSDSALGSSPPISTILDAVRRRPSTAASQNGTHHPHSRNQHDEPLFVSPQMPLRRPLEPPVATSAQVNSSGVDPVTLTAKATASKATINSPANGAGIVGPASVLSLVRDPAPTLPTLYPTPIKTLTGQTFGSYSPSISATRTPFKSSSSSHHTSSGGGGGSYHHPSSSIPPSSASRPGLLLTSGGATFGGSTAGSQHLGSSPPTSSSHFQLSSPQSLSLTRSLGLAPATPAAVGRWDYVAGTPEDERFFAASLIRKRRETPWGLVAAGGTSSSMMGTPGGPASMAMATTPGPSSRISSLIVGGVLERKGENGEEATTAVDTASPAKKPKLERAAEAAIADGEDSSGGSTGGGAADDSGFFEGGEGSAPRKRLNVAGSPERVLPQA